MPSITNLFHIALKTPNLEATSFFYRDILGMELAQRPALDFDGIWLKTATPHGEIIIHIYAGDAALEPDGTMAVGAGVIDHVALTAQGYEAFRQRFETWGLDWRENVLAEIGLWQLFVYDPSGVMLELSFAAASEDQATPEFTSDRQYRPREPFFDASSYPTFTSANA